MCEHPEACQNDDGECEWCEDLAMLHQQIRDLRAAHEARAIVIRDGEHRIDGPVGYLAQYGGTANFG